MKNQEIFNFVRSHLLGMKERCVDDFGDCIFYDNSTGASCAVGCLLPQLGLPYDDLKIAQNTNGGIGALRDNSGIEFPSWFQEALCPDGILLHLQKLHDSPENWNNDKAKMSLELEKIADLFDLTCESVI